MAFEEAKRRLSDMESSPEALRRKKIKEIEAIWEPKVLRILNDFLEVLREANKRSPHKREYTVYYSDEPVIDRRTWFIGHNGKYIIGKDEITVSDYRVFLDFDKDGSPTHFRIHCGMFSKVTDFSCRRLREAHQVISGHHQ